MLKEASWVDRKRVASDAHSTQCLTGNNSILQMCHSVREAEVQTGSDQVSVHQKIGRSDQANLGGGPSIILKDLP